MRSIHLGRKMWLGIGVVVFLISLTLVCSKDLGLLGYSDDIQGDNAPPKNVLLIIVDTLRADHVSCYGASNPTTPNIDALGKGGVTFLRAFSQAPWTLPAAATILTGLSPVTHGTNEANSVLPEKATTLAEILSDRGFVTQSFVTGAFMRARTGLSQGFDDYNERHVVGRKGVSSIDVTRNAIRWLKEHAQEKFFLMVHYYDPHWNYRYHQQHSFGEPRSKNIRSNMDIFEIRKRRSRLNEEDINVLLGAYDGEIHLMDQSVGRLLGALEQFQIADDTAVVFTSDHGEEFGEHEKAFGHTYTICNHVLHVPWIMAGPGLVSKAGMRIEEPVGTVDLVPTLLTWIALETPYRFDGVDLLPLIRGREYTRDPVVSFS